MGPRMHMPGASSGLWSIERVVALLTPVFSAGAGWLTAIIAKAIPGVNLPSGWVAALFGVGATAALGAALKWLHGRQKFVNFATDSEHVISEVVSRLQAIGGGVPLAEIERLLVQHSAEIIDTLGSRLSLPPSAEDIAKKIVQELWPHGAQSAGHGAQPAGGVAPQVTT